jgi:hypothetical protein
VVDTAWLAAAHAATTTPGAPPLARAVLRTREEWPRRVAAGKEAAAALWQLPASRPISLRAV